jgi:hypothetical protein
MNRCDRSKIIVALTVPKLTMKGHKAKKTEKKIIKANTIDATTELQIAFDVRGVKVNNVTANHSKIRGRSLRCVSYAFDRRANSLIVFSI